MFDKIADFILKHSKAIIVVWIVLLIASAYPAMHLGEVMEYDLTKMADSNSESTKGMQLMTEEFIKGDVPDGNSMQIILIEYEYWDEDVAKSFVKYIEENIEREGKATGVINLNELGGQIEVNPGAILACVTYKDLTTKEIQNDTPNLRNYINDCKNEFFKKTIEKGQAIPLKTYVTGSPAISYDMETNALSDISKIDPFTVLLILILVGLFFRSIITSATPPVTIGIAFAITACLIFFIGQAFNIFFITEMMILVAMMGAGCDYCIFIISRYKEELKTGKNHHDALRESIIWAGESIATSGCTVIIGFGAMAICSYQMVSLMGLCLALGILVALLAALTLIPSVINVVGEKIFWPSKMDTFKEGGKVMNGWYGWFSRLGKRYFHWSAKFSLKHAWAIVIVAILITAPAAYLTLTNPTSYDMISSMQSGESGEGLNKLGVYADSGMIMPNYAVIEYNHPIGNVTYEELIPGYTVGTIVWTEEFLSDDSAKLKELKRDITKADDDNIGTISSLNIWNDIVKEARDRAKIFGITDDFLIYELMKSSGEIPDQVIEYLETVAKVKGWTTILGIIDATKLFDNAGPYFDYMINCNLTLAVGGEFSHHDKEIGGTYNANIIKMSITTESKAMSIRSMETIDKIGSVLNDFVKNNTDTVTAKYFTGSPVMMNEISHVFSGEFRIIEIVVVILILILLFFVMKSYLIPIRSIVTILMSITWTLALTYFIFVNIMGGELSWMAPMLLLVICLGLGMDYDILLTTRIKENVTKGMSNDDAIYHAVTSTGSIITICGLIMGGAFGTLMLSSMELLSEFGFALCFAILVDALVIRTYVVPAVMHLLGDWNWKCPKFLKSKIKTAE